MDGNKRRGPVVTRENARHCVCGNKYERVQKLNLSESRAARYFIICNNPFCRAKFTNSNWKVLLRFKQTTSRRFFIGRSSRFNYDSRDPLIRYRSVSLSYLISRQSYGIILRGKLFSDSLKMASVLIRAL